MQIGPMHAEIRSSEQLFRHRQLARDMAGIPNAIEMGVGLKRHLPQPIFHADPAQHFHRVRHHLNSGPDAAEPRCLFINVDVAEPGPAKGSGRCQPTHASADDCNRQIFAGHASPPLRAGQVDSLFGILG